MMIAFPSKGSDLDAFLDGRFGRSPRFLLVDSETGAWEPLENGDNVGASQGSGIQSAQTVIGAGAQVVVSNHCGPKAFKVLQAAKIPLLQCDPGPIREILEAYRAGKLREMEAPDRTGHGG